MHPQPPGEPRSASFRDLDTTTLYAILKLRCDVFVVEQECCYADLDNRDIEPETRHLWYCIDGKIAAYLRIVDDGPALRIGRVVTAPAARGAGLASGLMTHALTIVGERPSVLAAQAYLRDFYTKFGYAQTGPEYLDDGIPHIPMARPAR